MIYVIIETSNILHEINYGTAHVKQTRVTHRASRNLEDNSHVGLVRHEYIAREQLLMS